MSNLADLRTRIITEINRDDLRDDLAAQLDNFIAKAIDDYAVRPFWFNEGAVNATASEGAPYVAVPTNIRSISDVFLLIGPNRYIMQKQDDAVITELYSAPSGGQPTDYAWTGDTLHVWPLPSMDYSMIWIAVSDVTPALDYTVGTSENVWTNQGQDLITAATKKYLYRDQFRDADGAAAAINAEGEAYAKLRYDSNRKISTGRMAYTW